MFLNPNIQISKHGRKLPHWQQGDAMIFVTWRLADSIPREKLDLWQAERTAWLETHPHPWDGATEDEYHDVFSRRLDEWLDAGEGSCVLRDPGVAAVMDRGLKHYDGSRFDLDSFVVMPNHVHVMFQPISPFRMERVIKAGRVSPAAPSTSTSDGAACCGRKITGIGSCAIRCTGCECETTSNPIPKEPGCGRVSICFG